MSLAAVAVAVVVRLLLDPLLSDRLPFITLFAAVVFAAWYCGRGPALLALIVGAVAVAYVFAEPRYSFAVSRLEYQVGVVLYAIVGFASIAMFDSLEKANQRLENERRRLEQEVAARHAAQRELADREELLRITLSSIGDAVITTDANGNVTYLNAVAQALTGWTQDNAKGKPLTIVFNIINEESRQTVESPVQKAMRDGNVVGLANHTLLISKDGTERPIDDSAAPIRDEQGHVFGCVLIFRDISDRRQVEQHLQLSETRFRSLVTATIAVVWTSDATGQFVTEQPSWAAFTGQTFDEYRGFGWADALHPDDRGRVRSLWETARAARTLYKAECRLWHAESKSYHHIMARGVPVIAADGSVREWVGKCMDVEEERQTEKKIYGLLAELKDADRRKDEFLAMLAHELRGPLAPLDEIITIPPKSHLADPRTTRP